MPTYKSFFDLPALPAPSRAEGSQPALGSSNGPMNPAGIIPLADGPGMVPLNGQTPFAVSPMGAPSSPMGSNPPAMLARPAAAPGLLAERANTPPPAAADLTKHYWKAAGSVLAGTGNQEHASAIMDLIKTPAPAASPSAAADAMSEPASRMGAPREWLGLHAGDFSIPSTLPALSTSNGPALSTSNGPARESWGTGLRGDFPALSQSNGPSSAPRPPSSVPGPLSSSALGSTDAPDTGLRTIILKQAAGQPLNNAEFRRLATRQSVEDSSSSQFPVQGSDPSNSRLAPGRSIESLMARTRAPLLDSSRPGDTAVDRLLRQSQTQSAIEDRTTQSALRRNTLARDNAKDQSAAAVAKTQGAFAQSGQPLTFDNAIKAGLPPEVADKYPKEKEGGFATAAEAQAAIPAGSKGQVQQAANGKWTIQFQTADGINYHPESTMGKLHADLAAALASGDETQAAALRATIGNEINKGNRPMTPSEYFTASLMVPAAERGKQTYKQYREEFSKQMREWQNSPEGKAETSAPAGVSIPPASVAKTTKTSLDRFFK